MSVRFKDDIAHLRTLAFKRGAKVEELVREFQDFPMTVDRLPNAKQIWNVYRWLLTPLSLWPIDVQALARGILTRIKKDEKLQKHECATLELLAPAPPKEQAHEIAQFEHRIEKGEYEFLLKQPEKYQELEAEFSNRKELLNDWATLKSAFEVNKFQNSVKIIRRNVSGERNFRPTWTGNMKTRKERFFAAFDAFCHRWHLWGMQGDKPLPLKVTANPTPHGILLMIPGLWSFDPRRDLDWAFIQKLHHAYGSHRQGPKLSKARIRIDSEARAVAVLVKKGKAAGLKGERLNDFILSEMKMHPGTDPSWIKRRLKRSLALSRGASDSTLKRSGAGD